MIAETKAEEMTVAIADVMKEGLGEAMAVIRE